MANSALNGLVPMRAGVALGAIRRYGAKRTAEINARREARIAEIMAQPRRCWSWRSLRFVDAPSLTRDEAICVMQDAPELGISSEWHHLGALDWRTAEHLSEVGLAVGSVPPDTVALLSTRTLALLVDYL